ncbi:MAG: hypothetical protein ACRD35_06975 [Candidatus Acidiferrales bacterium]
MLGFLASIVLSFLPPRYRRRWRHEESVQLGNAAGVSGLLQAVFCLLFYIAGFINYTPEAWIGPLAWMEYALHPSALLLGYFTLEGAVRMLVGLTTGEALATLPLALVAWTHTALERKRAEEALGPAVADLVERGDGTRFDLRIACSRPKDWDQLITISYQDELYELVQPEEGLPPRRFVYLLRKLPEGRVVRGLRHYPPEEPPKTT